MEPKDEDLMLEYLQGKQEALEMIFHRYKKPVMNYALRILGNRADAEDAASEVFLAVFSKKYRLNPNAKFLTWIFTVTRNECIDKIRKRKRIVSFWFRDGETEEMKAWDVPDEGNLIRDELESQELSQLVQQAIKRLPLPQKEALVLREYHALPYAEIAQILDCSVENVKILIFRAREHLRQTLPSRLKEGCSDGS